MKLETLFLAAMIVCLCRAGAADKPAAIEVIETKDFTTSVKQQLEKANILKSYESSPEISVQLVWSELDAAPQGQISEERIQPRSSALELNSTQRSLLLKALGEDSDYEESMAGCLCEFQPQLRVAFYSGTPEARYDILVSGISHGEVQAFQNGQLKTYARTSRFVPDLLIFLAATFPDHELTKMLRKFQESRKEANQQPTSLTRRG